jgi:hypothetical protein
MTKLTLTIVGEDDDSVIDLMLRAYRHLLCSDQPLREESDSYTVSFQEGNATCDVVHFTPATAEEPDITRLARAFTEHVHALIDNREDFYEILRRNRTESNAEICATHDFCDANILMSNAWQDLFPAETFCPQNPLHGTLWSAAWQKARTAEFDLQRLPLPA